MSEGRSKRLSTSRLGRMSQLGRLAGGMAGSIVSEGARRWSRGERWDTRAQALTPANMHRLTERLSQMRGAAMKLGQLLSMDAGHLLTPELAMVLNRLRKDAHAMPLSQLEPVLANAWGKDWSGQFSRFSYQPMASASIGQVHEATTKDGHRLAIKIQYPGVEKSIDSDLDNVATLLRWSRLLPEELDISPLLDQAKLQLKLETDYRHEADQLDRFRQRLADQPQLQVPVLMPPLCGGTTLAMSFLEGQPIECLEAEPESKRQYWTEQLFALFFRELFEFRSVQTDPNYANFLYDNASDQLGLIDFGAVRDYNADQTEAYRQLFVAIAGNDEPAMISAAQQIGYFAEQIKPEQQVQVLKLFTIAAEPLTQPGPFDFARSDLADRLREAGLTLSLEQGYWHSPPVASLFLHRKLAGLYLLAQRMKVKIDVARIAAPWLSQSG